MHTSNSLVLYHHAEEERAGFFTLIVLWLSVSFRHGAVEWSAFCDYGISWSAAWPILNKIGMTNVIYSIVGIWYVQQPNHTV